MWQKKWQYFWKQVAQSRGAFYGGAAVFGLVFLGLIGSVLTNFSKSQELEGRLADLRAEQAALQVERAELEADGLFYATDEYRELVLKSQGRKLPDETMLILPEREEVALAAPTTEVRESEKTSVAANWRAWLGLFFDR
ncbi:MAG: hypothetical protein LBM12_02245 [Candidatus Nomurabacteria bacterium]|jgi:hypothetical protein|nr:hypothetical protein [Candidatus Nomurabacteria bacterium]